MTRFVWIAVALQLAMVTAGHFSTSVLNLSGILGTGIPFAVGLVYGARVAKGVGASAKSGFVIGIVGAFIGVMAAILMGDQTWILLTFAPLSSGVTGTLGAVIGTVGWGSAGAPKARGKRKKKGG